jgi:hypothetical protein
MRRTRVRTLSSGPSGLAGDAIRADRMMALLEIFVVIRRIIATGRINGRADFGVASLQLRASFQRRSPP